MYILLIPSLTRPCFTFLPDIYLCLKFYLFVKVQVLISQSCPTLCDPHGLYVARWASLSMGFPRQEYWSRLSFPFPGDISDPGIEPGSPALQVDLYHLRH